MRVNLGDNEYVNVYIIKNSKDTYEYYIDDILVGVYDPDVMKDSKFLEIDLEKNNTIANELGAQSKDEIKQIIDKTKEKLNNVDVKEIEKEARENESINKYIEEIGIDREKIKYVTTKEIEREEKEDEQDEEDKKRQEEVRTNQVNQNGVEEKMTTRDVDIKQEISMGERATDVQNISTWLGGKVPKEFYKIGVIASNDIRKMKDDKGNIIDDSSTQFSLVVIGKDGKIEPLKKYIPQLEQSNVAGNNPISSSYQINADETVEKDPVMSEFRIGNKVIQIDKDFGDDVEVHIGKYSPFSNEIVTTQMRDSNTTFVTDIDQRRAAMGHYEGVYEAKNSVKEAENHEKAGCDELTVKEVDGEMDTGHQHYTNKELDQMVEELIKNPEISSVYNRNDIKRFIENKYGKNPILPEEGIKDLEEQIEEKAKSEHELPGHDM